MIRVCFFNEKSGVGKTTLSMLVAKTISTRFNKNVCIVDTVQGYRNLTSRRNEDLERFQFSKDNITPEIVNVINYEEFEKKFRNNDEYDIIFFDVQGISEGVIDFLLNSNYIFIISDCESEEDFKIDRNLYKQMQSVKYEKGLSLKEVFIIFNKIIPDSHTLDNINLSHLNIVEPALKSTPILKRISTVSDFQMPEVNALSSEILKLITINEKQIELDYEKF